MTKRILGIGWHPGSVNAIKPVLAQLDERHDVQTITHGEYAHTTLEPFKPKQVTDFGHEHVTPEALSEIVAQVKPDLVIAGLSYPNDEHAYSLEQEATHAANEQGIPTLAVLDYWANYKPRLSAPNEPFKFMPSKIAIMDELCKREMLAEGFDPEKLVITGNPHFDNLAQIATAFTEEKKQAMRNAMGVDGHLVFYATDIQGELKRLKFGYTDADCIEVLGRGMQASGRGDLSLVMKKHPREDDEVFAKLVAQARGYGFPTVTPGYESENIDTKEVVLASDLSVAPCSTVLLEATLMDKDALSIQPGLLWDEDPLVTNRLGVTPHTYDKDEGAYLAAQILQEQGIDTYREKRKQFRVNEDATERVTQLAQELLGI